MLYAPSYRLLAPNLKESTQYFPQTALMPINHYPLLTILSSFLIQVSTLFTGTIGTESTKKSAGALSFQGLNGILKNQ